MLIKIIIYNIRILLGNILRLVINHNIALDKTDVHKTYIRK